MKQLMIMAFAAFTMLFGGCKEEPKVHVEPEDILLPTKGVFPEGDTKFDELLVEIQKKYNFTVYYKNMVNANFNPPSANAYIADERELPDELKPHYINFLQRHILDYLKENGEWFPRIMKRNLYFVTNYRLESAYGGTRYFMDTSWTSFTNALPALGSSYTGTDYVSICLLNEVLTTTRGGAMTPGTKFYPPYTAEDFKTLRARFMFHLLLNAVQADKILVPTKIFADNDVVFGGVSFANDPKGYLAADSDASSSSQYCLAKKNDDRTGAGLGVLNKATATSQNLIEAPGYYKRRGALIINNDYTTFAGSISRDTTTIPAGFAQPSISHFYNSNFIAVYGGTQSLSSTNFQAKNLFLTYLLSIMALDLDPSNPKTINTPANWYFAGTEGNLWQDANYPLTLRCGATTADPNTVSLQKIENVKNAIIQYMWDEYRIDMVAISKGPDPMYVNLLED